MASLLQIGEILVCCRCLFALPDDQEMLVVTDELISYLPKGQVAYAIGCRYEVCKRVLYLSDTGIGGWCPVYVYTILRIFQQDAEDLLGRHLSVDASLHHLLDRRSSEVHIALSEIVNCRIDRQLDALNLGIHLYRLFAFTVQPARTRVPQLGITGQFA